MRKVLPLLPALSFSLPPLSPSRSPFSTTLDSALEDGASLVGLANSTLFFSLYVSLSRSLSLSLSLSDSLSLSLSLCLSLSISFHFAHSFLPFRTLSLELNVSNFSCLLVFSPHRLPPFELKLTFGLFVLVS
jgi:hypothetical protein